MLLLLLAAATAASTAEQGAIFSAAHFSRRAGVWKSGNCSGMESDSYEPGAIEIYRDLNGDGRPEAVVTEGGAICYGNVGVHSWILTKQASGRWTMIHEASGMVDFMRTTGIARMPDVSVGGPGFCFPVLRWNGKAYAQNRYEYEGKACRPR